MSNIENLLRRYNEGTITPDELDELNQLSHRDTVLASANKQANRLHHRRIARATAIVAILLVTGIMFFAQPDHILTPTKEPMMAQADIPTVVTPQTATAQSNTTRAKDPHSAVPASDNTVINKPMAEILHDSTPAPSKSLLKQQQATPKYEEPTLIEYAAPSTIADPTPIVACNTECTPDSVISDIWHFLRV